MQEISLFILFVLFIAIAWFIRSARFKGAVGETKVNVSLRALLGETDYRLFKNLTLPVSRGTTQIDHVVLSRFGVFVIETKNMKGWIYGSVYERNWTQVIHSHKSRFQNPVRQNFKHIKAIQELLGIEEKKIHGIVAFVGSAEPKSGMPTGVVWSVPSLAKFIKSNQKVCFDQSDLDHMAKALSQDGFKTDGRTRRAHVKHVKSQVAKRQCWSGQCPRCSAELVERSNKKTGNRFLGCSRFPNCRGTRVLS